MNERELKQILDGKSILFVDDKRITIELYRNELHRYGARTDFADSLSEAVEQLNIGERYDIVVIDLNMPSVPSVLKQYARKLGGVDMNEGQTLGLYLQECRKGMAYCYVSVIPHVYRQTPEEFEGNGQDYVLDKNAISKTDLPQRLVHLMRWGMHGD